MENATIGKYLKSARQNRNMTLEDVAALTGVSKPMLGQIERGQSSPTVNTLWKISTGMKIPFSSFLQEPKLEYTIVNLQEQGIITEENGAMRAYTLFGFDPIRCFETFYIEFDAGCQHYSEKHHEGVEESIFVIKGKLEILLNDNSISLTEKQAIRFEASVPHAYLNPHKELCCVYNTIFYKE
ncbi:MAG: helix-turn-helix domain-containing protein [Lachnospiraceae bacterium]|nr:helix-turn-helix domain-containing protein [Lachnospiraceae bacterium]